MMITEMFGLLTGRSRYNNYYSYYYYYYYVFVHQMNDQFAINLLAEEPVVVINDTHTWCDGGVL